MTRSTLAAVASLTLLTALPAATVHAQAADPLGIELNRLEDRDGGSCRVYLVIANKSQSTFEALKLDLVLFGTDGVIARRLAVDAAPVRPDKTAVKLFDVSGLACSGIGSVLLNDVLECRGPGVEPADCIGRIAPSSRAPIALTK